MSTERAQFWDWRGGAHLPVFGGTCLSLESKALQRLNTPHFRILFAGRTEPGRDIHRKIKLAVVLACQTNALGAGRSVSLTTSPHISRGYPNHANDSSFADAVQPYCLSRNVVHMYCAMNLLRRGNRPRSTVSLQTGGWYCASPSHTLHQRLCNGWKIKNTANVPSSNAASNVRDQMASPLSAAFHLCRVSTRDRNRSLVGSLGGANHPSLTRPFAAGGTTGETRGSC